VVGARRESNEIILGTAGANVSDGFMSLLGAVDEDSNPALTLEKSVSSNFGNAVDSIKNNPVVKLARALSLEVTAVDGLAFGSAPNDFNVWTGAKNAMNRAQAAGTTFDKLREINFINESTSLPNWFKSSLIDFRSSRDMMNVSGRVNVHLGESIKTGNTFLRVEIPAAMRNPKVKLTY
jgi:hypothetical protein